MTEWSVPVYLSSFVGKPVGHFFFHHGGVHEAQCLRQVALRLGHVALRLRHVALRLRHVARRLGHVLLRLCHAAL